MEIRITISNKLFNKEINNKFQDFFGRVIADIAGELNSDESCGMCGRYELETATLLKEAFRTGKYECEE